MNEGDGRVVSNFLFQALRGEALTIYGEGKQTRSFCYIDDLVEGMIRLMNSDYIGPMNVGNPDEFTILELADQVRSLIDPQLPVLFNPLPSDDRASAAPTSAGRGGFWAGSRRWPWARGSRAQRRIFAPG